MFQIVRERVFSASHQLRGYKGKCERLHGHNWRVRVYLEAEDLDECGMVLDFHDLDRLMAMAIDPFDHRHLNEVAPFDTVNPSAENLARVIAERVASQLSRAKVRVCCCDVWENDLSRARYLPSSSRHEP
ncbi:MAG: 6-carboxytetrahydropterin synthase QueD [Myxococcota bacterium]|jgi:6-pyruvoyltetrahydropterin/6-carboxytetrahydropterin synthase|nr:6-carboxytetrahydropterin synthase QueD [Myxococcota bacterium]